MARIEQHITDPRPLHHVPLHPAPSLSDVTCDFLHRLDDFRMVGLAGIAETLRKSFGPIRAQYDPAIEIAQDS